jgi:tRNA U34 5-carboxymethylaminomethyl modifying GTPase MnmE/TrmE
MKAISENTHFKTDLKTLVMIIGAIAIAVWTYSEINNRIISLETSKELMVNDLEKNTEFRIKWPRGELGSLPADSEQFMLIEHMAGQLEQHTKQLEGGMHNKVNIEFLTKQLEKALNDIEKLKDKIRKNGSYD